MSTSKEKQIIRSCGIYSIKSDDSISILGSYYEPTTPFSPRSENMVKLSASVISVCLGEVVTKVLSCTKLISIEEYNSGIDKQVEEMLLKFTGIKGERKLFRSAKLVVVSDDVIGRGLEARVSGKGWLVTPSEYIAEYGGYLSPLPDETSICPYGDADALTKMILEKFELCR